MSKHVDAGRVLSRLARRHRVVITVEQDPPWFFLTRDGVTGTQGLVVRSQNFDDLLAQAVEKAEEEGSL